MEAMEYHYQNDPEWKNETMGIKADRVGRFGCLITVTANLVQELFFKETTPTDINNMVKNEEWYWGPSVKGKESYINTDSLFDGIGIERKIVTEYKPGKNYYAKVKLFGGEHYVNIVNKIRNLYIAYDTYNGDLRYYDERQIVRLYEVERI